MLPEVHLLAGTRPEAIKLAPVAAAMRAAGRVRPVLVATGQHPTMVAEALAALGERADVTLELNAGGAEVRAIARLGRVDGQARAHDPALGGLRGQQAGGRVRIRGGRQRRKAREVLAATEHRLRRRGVVGVLPVDLDLRAMRACGKLAAQQ